MSEVYSTSTVHTHYGILINSYTFKVGRAKLHLEIYPGYIILDLVYCGLFKKLRRNFVIEGEK